MRTGKSQGQGTGHFGKRRVHEMSPRILALKTQIHVSAWPLRAIRPAPLQAHRGVWGEGPSDPIENTMAAFHLAINKYHYKMCECDLRLTKDDVPVVHHDEDLKRLWGEDVLLKDLPWSEVKRRTEIPKLEDILDLPCSWNLELKTTHFWNERLERKVADVLVRKDAQKRVLFSSFNPISLWKIQGYLPEVPRALLVSQEKDPQSLNRWYLRSMALAPWISFHLLHLRLEDVTEEELLFWKGQNVPVALWTVSDPVSEKIANNFLSRNLCVSYIKDSFY